MRAVRRHLRLGAATWLVCHVLAFSALVPRDCCAAHAHGAAAAAEAEAPAVDHSAHGMPAAPAAGHDHDGASDADGALCPMRGADGTPCPAHGGDGGVGGPTAACTMMTGVCHQPAAALAAVLMQAAVPARAFVLLPRVAARFTPLAADDRPHSLFVPPDSPPPRL